MTATVINGDCLTELKNLADGSVDAVVTDPPYNLSFMGKMWDSLGVSYQSWCEQWASECLRVLKPGGHLLAFGGTRTYHRLTSGIEDAGFEIRDSLHWIYGSGFPKSLDVSKAIDKQAGAVREIIGRSVYGDGHIQNSTESIGYHGSDPSGDRRLLTAPSTESGKQWSGWGTALKPAHEPIVLARKPLAAATVAANVTEYGCGGINVDGCRIGTDTITAHGGGINGDGRTYGAGKGIPAIEAGSNVHIGRWPANILLTHTPDCADECATGCPVAELDRQSGITQSSNQPRRNTMDAHNKTSSMGKSTGDWTTGGYADQGGASRFFYCAKAPRKERPTVDGVTHPTVKPLNLMRWLTRLVTPVGGTVLDPFAGTGTTGQACALEGFNSILIEREPSYIPLIEKRLADGG